MSESRHFTRNLAAEAVAAPVAVGALLIPLHGHLDAANGSLILVVAVVAVAARGQRWAAALTALVAAASFDFFFAPPYYSLRITSRDNLITELLLLVVGLVVGDLAARGRAHRTQAVERGDQVDRMHAVTELVAEGESPEFVTVVAAAELRDLLHLRDCRFSRSATATGATHVHPQRWRPHRDRAVVDGTVRSPHQRGRPSRSEPRPRPGSLLPDSHTDLSGHR